jgi:hypothetical protein
MINIRQLIVMFGNFHHILATQSHFVAFLFEMGQTNEVSKNTIRRNLADAIGYYFTTGIEQ